MSRSLFTLTAVAVTALLLCGCGGKENAGAAGGGSAATYPLARSTTVGRQPPITMSNGSVVILPALPTVYKINPTASCQRGWVSVPENGALVKKAVVLPPTPGLRAVLTDSHTARLTWWFHDVPDECRPVVIRLSIVAGKDPRATPLTKEVEIDGKAGSVDLAYPDFLDAPDVAIASTLIQGGLKSPDARVLIQG